MIDVGITLSIVGIVCGFFYFFGGQFIRRHFQIQDKAEEKRFGSVDEKIEKLAAEIYSIRVKQESIGRDVLISKERLVDVKEDLKDYNKKVNRLGQAFMEYNQKTGERFAKIEADNFTILKGRKDGK